MLKQELDIPLPSTSNEFEKVAIVTHLLRGVYRLSRDYVGGGKYDEISPVPQFELYELNHVYFDQMDEKKFSSEAIIRVIRLRVKRSSLYEVSNLHV